MLYLISYDVSTITPAGRRRLRRVAKACEDYGVRVQNSVFECSLQYEAFLSLKRTLLAIMDPNQDSIRFYPLGKNGREKVVHVGVVNGIDVDAPLIL